MDWTDVRHFLALARAGSVRAAGAHLGVSHSTVARRVESLEAKLSAQLFDRSRDGFALTEAGLRMLPSAERVEAEMAAIERDLVGRDQRLEGPISLTCCDEWVSEILLTRLTPFCAEHPDIELVVYADSRPFDLSKREADIAVRILARQSSPPEHLIGRRLAPMAIGLYVAVAHEARRDPDTPGSDPRWLAFDDRRQTEQLIASSNYPDLPVWGGFSTLGLMVQALRSGLGFGPLPCYIGDPDPRLRRLQNAEVRHMADLWLLSHPDLRNNVRLRAARLCVTEAMTTNADLFRGDRPRPTFIAASE